MWLCSMSKSLQSLAAYTLKQLRQWGGAFHCIVVILLHSITYQYN